VELRGLRAPFWLIVGWLAAIAVVAALVVDGRGRALERGERASASLAQVMEQHTARTFQAVSLSLAAVADAWQLSRPPPNDAAFRQLLRERLRELPYARAIFVVGPDGLITHDTDYPSTPKVSLADREYFRLHRDAPGLERSISPPVFSRTPGVGWFVSVTERLGQGSRFEGIVVAAIAPEYFHTLYAKMESDRDEALALFHRGGTLIARSRRVREEVGREFLHLPLFGTYLPRAPSGTYRVDGHMVPGKRIVSYGSVEGLPLVVHVSFSARAVLAEWRRSALAATVAMSALTLLLGFVVGREFWARRRRERYRAQRAQAEKLEAMGQLTGGIAHDFGNLLGIVSLNVELVSRHPGDADVNLRAVAAMRRALQRGSTLITRLLAFARRQPLEVRLADLNLLVTEVHPLIAQAAGPRIELIMQLAPSLPPAFTDSGQFEMALLNLVVNARDAMSGTGRIVLRTFAEPRTGAPCLEVQDDGPGMSEQTRRRAFEPFFTTKGERGTGLGLAQVYGFMRQIGGTVDIESRPGGGTRVYLHFRRAPIAARSELVTPA
jgi:signal transduction histidine kinase